MIRRLLAMIGAVALVLAASGCGSDDTSDTTDVTDATDAADDDATDDDATDDDGADDDADDGDEAAASDGPCPVETAITITASGDDADIDGEMDLEMTFIDIVLGQTGTLVLATYELEASEQFGLRAPVGQPDVDDGGIIFMATLLPPADEDLAPGDFSSEDSEGQRIGNYSLWTDESRVLPLADIVITLTEVGEDEVCGEITADADSSFPQVSGEFVVERIGS
ncbi:MAG: hypothetical protein JJU45_00305 [Acidimicrobiia bacterium]|nr:hypothetical protein [Acidimicrobiia bacterium]